MDIEVTYKCPCCGSVAIGIRKANCNDRKICMVCERKGSVVLMQEEEGSGSTINRGNGFYTRK